MSMAAAGDEEEARKNSCWDKPGREAALAACVGDPESMRVKDTRQFNQINLCLKLNKN
jgi:hypothetical protein